MIPLFCYIYESGVFIKVPCFLSKRHFFYQNATFFIKTPFFYQSVTFFIRLVLHAEHHLAVILCLVTHYGKAAHQIVDSEFVSDEDGGIHCIF